MDECGGIMAATFMGPSCKSIQNMHQQEAAITSDHRFSNPNCHSGP